MEKNEIDPYRDYFEMMSSEREANMNRQGYKRMKSDFLQEQGLDPLLIDLDYAYDAGNEANTDILPAVSKKEDGSVTEDILLDTNTREGMAWAAASKELYDAFYGQDQTASNAIATDRQGRRNQFNSKRHYKDAPKTPQEFAQWGIEHIGWLNYNLPSLGVASTKLPYVVKKNPKAAYAFLHLLNTYGELPMFTWNGTKRFFNGVLKDPTTYVGLGTLGIGLAGKKFTTAAGKGGLKKALRAAIDPAAITMYEGALYAASDDFFRQKVAIQAGPDVEGGQESYDPVRGLTAAGGGALFGGALYGTAKVGANVAPLAIDAVKGVINKGAEDAKARIAERQSGTQLYSNPIGPIADEVISRMGGGGEGPPPGRNLDEFGFYSKAEEALNNIKQEKGTGRQFVNQLKNQFNVKEKELYWLGLDKFETDEKVDKKTLIDTVKQNYVKIRENKYSFDGSPTGDNADITDVNQLSFNLLNETDYDNYSFDAEVYHDEYQRGGLADGVYDTIAQKLGYYTEDEMIARQQAGQPRLSERDEFNTTALYQAFKDGYSTFRDVDGDEVDFLHDLNDIFDEMAYDDYITDPNASGTDTLGLNYQIRYDRYEQSFTVFDPRGFEVGANVRTNTLNEAEVLATQDAYDQGYLLMTDPDEIDAIEGAVDQDTVNPGDPARPVGKPLWAGYKLFGGTNYRELVLENTSFKGDPDADAILQEVDDAIAADRVANEESKKAFDMLETYQRLPASEKKEFLNQNNTDFIELVNKRAETKDKALQTFLSKKEILDKYAMERSDLNSPISNEAAINRAQGLKKGPRTHYGSLTNDIGHMRVTDRVSTTGEKILFVEEIQSDWSQARASMPTPKNIERAKELSNLQIEEDTFLDNIENDIKKYLNEGVFTPENEQLFNEFKNEVLLLVDNDSRLASLTSQENIDQFKDNLENLSFNSVISAIKTSGLTDNLIDARKLNQISGFKSTRQKSPVDYITDAVIDAGENVTPDAKAFNPVFNRVFNNANIKLNELVRQLQSVSLQRTDEFDKIIRPLYAKGNKNFMDARMKYGPVARGPFVGKSNDIVELQLKSLIRRAVEEDHKFIVIPLQEVHIDRWGSSYTEAFNTHYGIVVPDAAETVLKQFDRKAKVFYKKPEEISKDFDGSQADFTPEDEMLIIPISDEMRNSVKKGMSLFELGTLAGGGAAVAGSQMTQQENTEPGI